MINHSMLRILCGFGILLFMVQCDFERKPVPDKSPSVTIDSLTEIKEGPGKDSYGFADEKTVVKEGIVRKNESLYVILRSLDVSPQTIYDIERKSKNTFSLNRIRPGQNYLVYGDEKTHQASRMILHNDMLEYVIIDWEDEINIQKGTRDIETRIAESSGVITSSLYESLAENGSKTLLANYLSDVFGWQIDFFRLFKNDAYKIIYEEQYVDGKPYGISKILAAEFIHSGEVYDAFYFESGDRAGYYDGDGKSVQKALLKAPFKFSQRISSGFSSNRFHPVLKRRMPHYGVDYAAPLGTPVISVGDGEVIESQYRGANGNIVKIKHNSTYTTAYLHLNGFARGIRKGAKVKQGQVIGYVGRTGRVTGVHLDYRVYKNGSPVNPLNLKLPPSKSISAEEMHQFKRMVDRYRFEMNEIDEKVLAYVEN